MSGYRLLKNSLFLSGRFNRIVLDADMTGNVCVSAYICHAHTAVGNTHVAIDNAHITVGTAHVDAGNTHGATGNAHIVIDNANVAVGDAYTAVLNSNDICAAVID